MNGIKEGAWLFFAADEVIFEENIYKDGGIKKTISHRSEKKFNKKRKGGEPDYNFPRYLDKALEDVDFGNIKTDFRIPFTIHKDGKLSTNYFREIEGIPTSMHIKIVDAIISAPAWKPLYIDDEISESVIFIHIFISDQVINVKINK